MLALWVLNYTFCQIRRRESWLETWLIPGKTQDAVSHESAGLKNTSQLYARGLIKQIFSLNYEIAQLRAVITDYAPYLQALLQPILIEATSSCNSYLHCRCLGVPSPSSPSECSYQWQQWLYYSKYFPSLWYHVPSITMNFARKRIRSFLNSSGSGMIGSRPGFIRSQYKI